MSAALEFCNVEQGSKEWLDLRRTKITATDAGIIMGASRWKTKVQLYNEKVSGKNNTFVNDKMQRGLDLEPFARSLFTVQSWIEVKPKVVVKDWAMASLDGISECGKYIVEIKCPGTKIHEIALLGKVPDHYYPQLQHQMYVCNVPFMYYFSFDGSDGIIVEVQRDQDYIDKMIIEEKKFYNCLIAKNPPEPDEGDYIERTDDLWEQCATQYQNLMKSMKELEQEQEYLKKKLIFLSGESNTTGAGLSLCQVTRKGNIDYSKIDALNGIDLEEYRNPSTKSWRITS